ncbi:MAG: hypothetical protein ACXWEI_03210, partial [Mycobacterium sp.]
QGLIQPSKTAKPPTPRVFGGFVFATTGFQGCARPLDIPDELQILCGLAVGYADPAFPANQLRTPRNPVGENVVFLDS